MKTFIFPVIILLTTISTTNAADCSQKEKDSTNKLQQQDKNPAKTCYERIDGDVLQVDTRVLCDEPVCVSYLAKLGNNLPDCDIDGTNYRELFGKKAGECGVSGFDTSGSGSSSNSTSSSDSSSDASASEAPVVGDESKDDDTTGVDISRTDAPSSSPSPSEPKSASASIRTFVGILAGVVVTMMSL
jgi:opacity protein-like surface antigen